MKVFTIGFTKKSAREFFTKLRNAQVKRLIDVRLNNVSQLAGFAKREDLRYFLDAICGISYFHIPELAPTQEMLTAYRKGGGDWSAYEQRFIELIAQRRIENVISPETIAGACLLCSEETPEHCHRRLVVEYLAGKWGKLEIEHLL